MTPFFKTCATVAACTALLAACGGGNDDDPTPSDEPGVLTVTNSTADGFNGIYGNGTLNLTDVEKKNPIGSSPEVCSFRFDGANKVGSSATALGDIRYRPDTNVLYAVFITLGDREFTSDGAVDTEVLRDRDQVRLNGKTLIATDGSNAQVKVTAIIPMRPNRPLGC